MTTGELMESISSPDRLNALLEEANTELERITPRIEELEAMMAELKELKLTRQKLITLKLSLQSILANFSGSSEQLSVSEASYADMEQLNVRYPSRMTRQTTPRRDTFYPEKAFSAVDSVLKQKQSLNYEIFRAIVLHGGRASTEQIRDFLIQHDIRQPMTGESFSQVELTDVSSRVNYLVRKGIVASVGKGVFESMFGWDETDSLTDA